jgi:hypothetical protein
MHNQRGGFDPEEALRDNHLEKIALRTPEQSPVCTV